MVVFSIASGVMSMQDIGRVGSVGGKTIVYYMCTTAFAVVLALVLASAAKGIKKTSARSGTRLYRMS